MKYVLPIIFLCGAVLAQVPIQRRIPWFAGHGTAPVPETIPGLALWWVFTDATNALGNNVAVSSWVDRIQGVVLKNDNTGVRPTNSASGIGFGDNNSDTWLTNQPVTLTSNITMIVLAQCNKFSADGGLNGGSFSELDKMGWGFKNNGNGTTTGGAGASGSSSANFTFDTGGLLRSNKYGLAWVSSNQPPQQSKGWFYTNGVVDNNGNTVNSLYGGSNFVMAATGRPVGQPLGSFTAGYELELLVYTNVLTPAQISTIQTYFNTTYP